jgi:hypothetical protein
MVLNALSQIALDKFDHDRSKAQDFMSHFHSISFGIKPPWQSSATDKMSPYLDIQRDGVELYIIAYDDIFPPKPKYSLNAYDVLARALKKNKNSKYVVMDHEGDSKHKLLVILAPGIVQSQSSSGQLNMGNHKLLHYLEALDSPDLAQVKSLVDLLIHDTHSFKHMPGPQKATIQDKSHHLKIRKVHPKMENAWRQVIKNENWNEQQNDYIRSK